MIFPPSSENFPTFICESCSVDTLCRELHRARAAIHFIGDLANASRKRRITSLCHVLPAKLNCPQLSICDRCRARPRSALLMELARVEAGLDSRRKSNTSGRSEKPTGASEHLIPGKLHPARPHTSVTRPFGRPPPVTSSSPLIPVGTLASEGRATFLTLAWRGA
jgi:hypothetical protein